METLVIIGVILFLSMMVWNIIFFQSYTHSANNISKSIKEELRIAKNSIDNRYCEWEEKKDDWGEILIHFQTARIYYAIALHNQMLDEQTRVYFALESLVSLRIANDYLKEYNIEHHDHAFLNDDSIIKELSSFLIDVSRRINKESFHLSVSIDFLVGYRLLREWIPSREAWNAIDTILQYIKSDDDLESIIDL